MGYNAETYFEVIGYPDWWASRPAVIGKNSGHEGRTGVGQGRGRGRSSRDRGISPQANITDAENQQPLVPHATSSISLSSHGFTEDQLKALQRLLNKQVSDSKEKFNGHRCLPRWAAEWSENIRYKGGVIVTQL
ncbi:hypothetical protein Dimus_014238 [Dionaea muscipula]